MRDFTDFFFGDEARAMEREFEAWKSTMDARRADIVAKIEDWRNREYKQTGLMVPGSARDGWADDVSASAVNERRRARKVRELEKALAAHDEMVSRGHDGGEVA